jgi:hypothetical protein
MSVGADMGEHTNADGSDAGAGDAGAGDAGDAGAGVDPGASGSCLRQAGTRRRLRRHPRSPRRVEGFLASNTVARGSERWVEVRTYPTPTARYAYGRRAPER